MHITHGINSRKAIECWVALGGHVEPFAGTGELCLRHPLIERPLRINGRRKDAPRSVTGALRWLASQTDTNHN